jgi:hypothetical protein
VKCEPPKWMCFYGSFFCRESATHAPHSQF